MLEWSTWERGRLAVRIGGVLGGFAESRRVGWAVGGAGFVLARRPDTVRAADVAFVRAERVARPVAGYLEGAPDLAVEILAPEHGADEVRKKIADWIQAGAIAAWVVDPESRTVTVHRPRAKPEVLGEAEMLHAEGALRGLELPVRDIFVE
jgi:Uma2 family endonuclease